MTNTTPLTKSNLSESGYEAIERGRMVVEGWMTASKDAGFKDYAVDDPTSPINHTPEEAFRTAARDVMGDIASSLFADQIAQGVDPEDAIANVGKALASALSDVLVLVPGGEASTLESDEDFGTVGYLASHGVEGFESTPLFG